jgi:cyclophilin family peptidyl-prolyl cis-trans isomerase
MEHDTKITYSVIAILVVILGGVAYYLQSNRNLPQVQVTESALESQAPSTSMGIAKKTQPLHTVQMRTANAITNSNSTSTIMTLPEKITSATITTNKGDIEITFATNTPETVRNFAKLAASGFYDGTKFHRVIRDFMIQGGDPLSKDDDNKVNWGRGGPGYTFKDEISANDVFSQGVVAMANGGPNTNGSQFFIVTAIAGTPWLAGKHTIFGHVTNGLDIALRIGDMQTDGSDRPLQDVIVEKVVIH